MEDTKKCPQCGVENPISRVTCQVCHAKLNSTKTKDTKTEPETQRDPSVKEETTKEESPKPQTRPKKTPPKKPSPTERAKTDAVAPKSNTVTTLDYKVSKKKKTTSRRRKKIVAPSAPTYFTLQDGKLQAVHLSLVVSKPIKKKQLPSTEQNILTVWNRNKDLFNG